MGFGSGGGCGAPRRISNHLHKIRVAAARRGGGRHWSADSFHSAAALGVEVFRPHRTYLQRIKLSQREPKRSPACNAGSASSTASRVRARGPGYSAPRRMPAFKILRYSESTYGSKSSPISEVRKSSRVVTEFPIKRFSTKRLNKGEVQGKRQKSTPAVFEEKQVQEKSQECSRGKAIRQQRGNKNAKREPGTTHNRTTRHDKVGRIRVYKAQSTLLFLLFFLRLLDQFLQLQTSVF